MSHIKGITVTLVTKKEIGMDSFGQPILKDIEVNVENVLVSPTSTDDIINQLELHGKKAIYTLAIPKNDKNNWEDVEVIFFNKRWRTFGFSIEGIEEMIPLDWNKKVMVERYE